MPISAGIDERVCIVVELGLKERLYFQRVIVPGMNNRNGNLVRVNRPKWLPVTGPVQNDLFDTVRNNLRPVPTEHQPLKGAPQQSCDSASSTRRSCQLLDAGHHHAAVRQTGRPQ